MNSTIRTPSFGRSALALVLLAGCSSDAQNTSATTTTTTTSSTECVPGAQVACACPGGGSGVQVCNAAGTALGPCSCDGTGGAGGGTGGAGGGATGGGGGGTGGAGASGGGLPATTWSKRFGDADPAHTQVGLAIATRANDEIALGANLQGTMDLGGGVLTSAAQSLDVVVAKLDGAGNHLWSKRFGDPESQTAASVAMDGSGAVVLTGGFAGSVDFGSGALFAIESDVGLVKLDANGDHVWSHLYGGAGNQFGTGVAIEVAGNILLTGIAGGAIDFGAGPLPGSGTAFLAKLDPGGNHIWSKRYGTTGGQNPMGVAVDGAGNVAIAGYFYGSVDFGGGLLTAAGSSDDAFVAVFDSGGNHAWSKRFGDDAKQRANGVAFAPNGDVVIVGDYLGVLDLGGGALPSAGAAINTDNAFVARFDGQGNHVWSAGFDDGGQMTGYAVTTDAAGNAAVAGFFEQTVDFGLGALVGAGSRDFYVARFAPDGTCLSARASGGASDEYVFGVAPLSGGQLAITGYFSATLDLGDGPLVSAGGYDLLLARIDP